MASIRNLKKDLNNIIGEIIQNINSWELENPEKDQKKSEKLVDKCFSVFDSLIEKINQKDISKKKTHFKKISLELTKKAEELVKNFNDL
jgi:DNA-binding transcriptional regulator GbsR (MarR family)